MGSMHRVTLSRMRPLQTFVHKMWVMHGDLPVVQRLVADVGEVSASMLEQLLQRLQASIQLPECLRVIGYLRRLAAFPGGWTRHRVVEVGEGARGPAYS